MILNGFLTMDKVLLKMNTSISGINTTNLLIMKLIIKLNYKALYVALISFVHL